MKKVDIPVGEDGNWRVEKFTVSEEDAEMSRMRSMFSGGYPVPAGDYTALRRGKTLVMSDTPSEMMDHYGFVYAASGRVVIVGLGIGMVLQAVLDKEDVDHVTVVEKAPEVVRLVGPTYQERYGDRLEIVQSDIMDWRPPKGTHKDPFDAVWFDIWDFKCTDNLEQMTKLKRRWARWARWKGCWSEDTVRQHRERERAQDRTYQMFAQAARSSSR